MPEAIQNLSETEIWPVAAVFGEVTYPAGGRYGPRVQADVQLVVADRGGIRLDADGSPLRLPAGEQVCQWPGSVETWRFDPDRPTTHRWIALSFDAASAAAVSVWAAAAPRTTQEHAASRALSVAGLAIRGDGSAAAEATRLRLAAAALRLFVEGSRADGAAGRDDDRLPPPLRAMQSHLAAHATERLNLTDLAAAAHVTPSHLVRLSREHLGLTPMALVWETRVRRGLDLLKNTGLTVAEVADQCGFASPFHFSRRVKQAAGKPPRELRGLR